MNKDTKIVIVIDNNKETVEYYVDKYGQNNVIGIIMPDNNPNAVEVAKGICNYFGIDYHVIDVRQIESDVSHAAEKAQRVTSRIIRHAVAWALVAQIGNAVLIDGELVQENVQCIHGKK